MPKCGLQTIHKKKHTNFQKSIAPFASRELDSGESGPKTWLCDKHPTHI